VADTDLVVTGEGRLDGQSVHGKTPLGVARIARRHGKPVVAIAGGLGAGAELLQAHGIDAMFCAVQRACSLEQALAQAARTLSDLAAAAPAARAPAFGRRDERSARRLPPGPWRCRRVRRRPAAAGFRACRRDGRRASHWCKSKCAYVRSEPIQS